VEQRAAYENNYHRYTELKTHDFQNRQPIGTTDNTAEQQRVMAEFASMREAIHALYDGAILLADESLGKVIALLKAQGRWDETLFIVVADHGESFGEHDVWFHEQAVYDAIMHVPLMIRFPRGEFGGRRVNSDVSLVDLVPTIFDYLGRPELCGHCRGSSLLPLVRGLTASHREGPLPAVRINQTTYYRPAKQRRGDVNVMMRSEPWKAIWNEEHDSLELYDLTSDPAEQTDLAGGQPEVAQRLRKQAMEWYGNCQASLRRPERVELDEREREKLRALGYAH
jgi:arylsulfatase A-like enzyme